MIIDSKEIFDVQQCYIQYRISSINSSGLTNVVKQYIVLNINQSKLSGSNLINSNNNGYIASTIFVNIQLNISNLSICVDDTQRLGFESVQIIIIGSEFSSCDLCEQQKIIAYGLCSETLNYSETVNGMFQCVYPFEYVDSKCICADGYLLNNTHCINIVESINNMSYMFISNFYDQILLLEQKIENIFTVDQEIINNVTELENRIMFNYSIYDYNLMMNTSTLDNRIYYNITSLQNDILMKQITADTNLLTNTTVLDQRIFNNVSELKYIIQNLTLHQNDIDDSMLKYKQIIEQQQNMIHNLSQQIYCTRNYGYSVINGTCIQVSCTISGQQSINGICQCTNINSIVVDGSCVCPINSNIIGSACVCSISGQTMQNGQCICQTTGAFVVNNVCTCGVNGTNISNSCSCPDGAYLLNGVCTCSNINAYISGNQCVCPVYSKLINNTCTCPNNSQLVNNECVCNQINGYIMKNGLCLCKTIDAYENYGACICGQSALNISNTCICPTNSTLINNICQCDKIVGQQMVSGACQCPQGYSVVNDSCYQTSYIINSTNFECSQEVFTQSFDIVSITNQILAQSNFSSGYVFSASTVVENAFISVSDNIYTSSIYPLFQSQNVFNNIKLSFGKQTFISGSLILSSTTSISINQMNIISKSGSQLTVSSYINIITSSSTNANITNLLVNVSFGSSSGNITLINNIIGVLNISRYQVLGSFVSSKTVTMIGINIKSATISVNQIIFQPTAFNVGNGSSYLFGNAVTTSSVFTINNVAVILGNSSNSFLLGSISTTNYDSNYYNFGGIIAYINSNSTVNINNVIYDSFQKISTFYVSKSGFLLGYIQSINSRITIKNVCLLQNISSTTIQFYHFGLIGWNSGNTSVQGASIMFQVQGSDFYCLGIIGIQRVDSSYAEVINMKAQVNFNTESGDYVGSIMGSQEANNCSIENITINSGNINSGSNYVGGLCGWLYQNTNTSIQNSIISKTNISGLAHIGSFIGVCYSTMYLINSKTQFVRLSGSNHIGVIVGYNNGVYIFSGSSSTSNYINNVKQNNCAILLNIWSVVGC
ncbi:Conserved_hypothetical protein [Hexamita inflata]|uniref:EGF-like domain-containing protein n=1 Tax=Hexamita inflata TaxID=28002 RepID=A0AA86ULK2_9EUKA|nr:Conserved hypothetical protein [Hexamita inflata]